MKKFLHENLYISFFFFYFKTNKKSVYINQIIKITKIIVSIGSYVSYQTGKKISGGNYGIKGGSYGKSFSTSEYAKLINLTLTFE